MAKKDIMTANGVKLDCVNIQEPVGKDQPNRREDVMLIQAAFEKLAEMKSPAFLGLRSWDEVPEPTGNFEDDKTEKAIWSYQRKNARRLLHVDGKIHAAAYENRNIKIKDRNTRLMTITLLHFDLAEQHVTTTTRYVSDTDTYIGEITRTVPDLRHWIK